MALVFLLTACTSLPVTPQPPTPPPAVSPPPPFAPPPSPTPAPENQGPEVVVLLPEPPDTLNPLYTRSWSGLVLQSLFLPGLFHLNERLEPVPELAQALPSKGAGTISEDGRTITIRLRPDLAWSDGHPLTADDLLFTYEMAVAEGNHPTTRFPYDSFVESIASLDQQTVEVRFTHPFAPWPIFLFPYILPRHVLEPIYAQSGSLDGAEWNQMPAVGSGPYLYAGQEGADLLFEANPRYWRGSPPLGRLRVRWIPDPVERWGALTDGTAHLAPFLWPETDTPLVSPDGVLVQTSPSGYVEMLLFDLDPRLGHPALQDRNVRLALVQAIDRQRLCDDLGGGVAQPAATLLSGTRFEALPLPTPSPLEAVHLLEDAGWRDTDGDGVRDRGGISLTLRYALPTSGPDRALTIPFLTGIGVQVEQVPPGPEPWEEPARWDLAQWAGQPPGYPDPDDPRWLCVQAGGAGNPASVCDEELDRLLIAQSLAADLEERTHFLAAIQERASAEGLWVPLCRWEDQWAVSAALANTRPWRGDPFWNVWEWRVEGGG